jgi:PAS domain S-box-containing protein
MPNLSIKTKIVLTVGITVLLVNTLVAHQIWLVLNQLNRNINREKLVAIALSAASQVDLKKHEKIKGEEDILSPEYQKVQSVLQGIKNANPAVDDIYTMRKTDSPNVWQFVLGASETEDKNGNGSIEENETAVKIGEKYDVSKLAEMQKAFDLAIADEEINCDKWGCFFSGYAPIRDETGNALAIVGVDIKADDVVAYEKKTRLFIDFLAISLAIFYPLLIFLLIRTIIRPVYSIINGLDQYSDNLSHRIKIKSKDEFGLIAESFNRMAAEIENLYSGMEKKVREKTRELNDRMKELQQRKAEDEALLASIGEGMVATDWNGRIIAINKVAEKMLGCDGNKILGTSCEECFNIETLDGESVPLEKRPSHKVVISKKMATERYNFITSKNLKIPIIVTASPIIIKGRAVGAIMVIRDITKEVEIDRAKSEFVSLASHQLRTPLTTVNWYLEMIFDDPNLTNRQKNNLQEIYTANQRLIGLVGDLLNVSRLELGKFIIKISDFPIVEIIESVLKELVPFITDKKIKIAKKYQDAIPKMKSDDKLVRIVLQNIINNAVKYTPAGGTIDISVKMLSLSKKLENEYFEIKVADTGYGIPKDQQKFIFTKLFRADNVKQKETDGNGLGMYIAKSFVEKLGGSITFISKENKGTTFTIVLPVKSQSIEDMKKDSDSV